MVIPEFVINPNGYTFTILLLSQSEKIEVDFCDQIIPKTFVLVLKSMVYTLLNILVIDFCYIKFKYRTLLQLQWMLQKEIPQEKKNKSFKSYDFHGIGRQNFTQKPTSPTSPTSARVITY